MATFQVGIEKKLSEFEESYDDDHPLRSHPLRGAFFSQTLNKVPQRTLVTVQVGTTVAATIAKMNENHVGCAVVVENGRLAGIFTERDVLQRVAGKVQVDATPIERVMTSNPDTLPGDATVASALHHMVMEGYRQVPLVDGEDRPLGVVGVADIIGWLCELYPARILNQPPKQEIPLTADGA